MSTAQKTARHLMRRIQKAARLIDDGILPVELEIDAACSGGGERQEDKA